MKGFLIDENVPGRILFAPSLPVFHTRELGDSPSDSDLWSDARNHALVIITKDVDFSHRVMLSEPPPWVVHLRIGNVRGREYHQFLSRVWPQIERLLPAHKLLAVFQDRIETVR